MLGRRWEHGGGEIAPHRETDGRTRSDARKTILYIHHSRGLGGALVSLVGLVQRLDHSKYRPVVVCLYNSEVVPYLRAHGIEVQVCEGLSVFQHTTAGWFRLYSPLGVWYVARELLDFLPSAWRTKHLVHEQRADLVHLNSLILAPSALGTCLAGLPLIWHIRESVIGGRLDLRRRLLSWMVNRLADEAVFICEDDKRRLAQRDQGIVVRNSVDFQRYLRTMPGEPARAELGITGDAKVILHLGGVSRIKGTLELLQAMVAVKLRVPLAVVIIAGNGPPSSHRGPLLARIASRLGYVRYGELVRRTVERTGLHNSVRFLPFRDDAERLIAASDVIVFPSVVPHFARPIMEAGAMAKPVVASRIGGVEEVVQDGETGLLVPPGDVGSLAEAIQRVLLDTDLARSLGDSGYRQALRLFNAETNVHQTMQVYESVLAQSTVGQ